MSLSNMSHRSGASWRELFRAGHEVATTAGLAPGLAQANLVILRKEFGDPLGLGIADLSKPDMGEAVDVLPGEIPVFWACGCTPQAVIMRAKPQLVITHAPGHMFITDWQDRDLLTY